MRTQEQLAENIVLETEVTRKMLAINIMKCKHAERFANAVLKKYYASFRVKSIRKKIASRL